MDGRTNANSITATLTVRCTVSSTVKVTKGSLSYTKSGTNMVFALPGAGTWTVSCTYGVLTDTRTITFKQGESKSITVNYQKYLYKNGTYDGLSSTWTKSRGTDTSTNKSSNASSYVECKVQASGSGTAYYRSSAINLTNIKTLKVTGKDGGHISGYADGASSRLSLLNSSGTEVAYLNHWQDDMNGNWTWTQDVSSRGGTHYLEMKVTTSDYTTRTVWDRIFTIWVSPT